MIWEDLPLHFEQGMDVFLFSSHCDKNFYLDTVKKFFLLYSSLPLDQGIF